MKSQNFLTLSLLAAGWPALAAEPMVPLAAADLVFDGADGLVAVEAEHFHKQTGTAKRAWYITTSKHTPGLKPDSDESHAGGASGGAYVEALPDTRTSHDDKLIKGENMTDEAGAMAVLYYKVNISRPGRYYIWVRAFSTNTEDNGIHVGLNGQWPASGQRWQTVKKNSWAWECKQRTPEVHNGVPMQLFLDIEKAGENEIMFSMREDGFEMDKFILASDKEFKPADKGPAVKVLSGKLPEAFPEIAQTAQAPEPPRNQNIPALAMGAKLFMTSAKGYYLDKGKWLAINPDKNQEASAEAAFPFPAGKYDMVMDVVGESDGQAAFQLALNARKVGEFTAPASKETFEEGPLFSCTWKNIDIPLDSTIRVSSQIASADGKEWSRARVANIRFIPADGATRAAAAKVVTTNSTGTPATKPVVYQSVPRQPDGNATTVISGETKQWHKVTLTLDGPFAAETDGLVDKAAPLPFTDLAFNVKFKHESGSPSCTVPGYFAADGDAANTSAASGTKWRAHLSPDQPGLWNYTVSFTKGKHAALDGGGVPLAPFDGVKGSFTVAGTDKTGRDFRSKGRLQYVGKHYLQFAGSKEYFLKAGPDSPETLLAFADFDNTTTGKPGQVPVKTWAPHAGDWKTGDPTWKAGQGKNLIGALNYLAAKGVNAFSFLTYNAAGDGDNVWPFIGRNEKLHYDCSKLDQWGIVFDHATALGLFLHFKLQENESDDNRLGGPKRTPRDLPEALDGGKLGTERKLYCRELIARYGHALALNWNIGEENTQSTEEVRDMVKYLHDTDPYHHHIVLHTFPPELEEVYRPLIGDKSLLTGVSIQTGWKQSHAKTLQWRKESAATGRPWVIAHDEQNPAGLGVPPDPGYKGHSGIAEEKAPPKGKEAEGFISSGGYTMHDIRKTLVWGHFLAGGAGLEYYFGYSLPENDLVCEDFRSRDKSWDYCRIALDFFRDQKIPLTEMSTANALIGNPRDNNDKYCSAKPGELYLVYLPEGGVTGLDLSGMSGTFTLQWFNPREGGALTGSSPPIAGGDKATLTAPDGNDWLAVIRKNQP